MTIDIRRATPVDLDAIAPLFDAYRRFYGQPGDLPRARVFLSERMQAGDSVVLLAERDGHAVGFTQLYPLFSSVRTARGKRLPCEYYVDYHIRHQERLA